MTYKCQELRPLARGIRAIRSCCLPTAKKGTSLLRENRPLSPLRIDELKMNTPNGNKTPSPGTLYAKITNDQPPRIRGCGTISSSWEVEGNKTSPLLSPSTSLLLANPHYSSVELVGRWLTLPWAFPKWDPSLDDCSDCINHYKVERTCNLAAQAATRRVL